MKTPVLEPLFNKVAVLQEHCFKSQPPVAASAMGKCIYYKSCALNNVSYKD